MRKDSTDEAPATFLGPGALARGFHVIDDAAQQSRPDREVDPQILDFEQWAFALQGLPSSAARRASSE